MWVRLSRTFDSAAETANAALRRTFASQSPVDAPRGNFPQQNHKKVGIPKSLTFRTPAPLHYWATQVSIFGLKLCMLDYYKNRKHDWVTIVSNYHAKLGGCATLTIFGVERT